jgi:hypothetical protein
MSSISNFFNAVGNAFQSTTKAVSQTAEAAIDAATTYINERVEDIADVGEAAASGNLIGAGVEFVEAMSLGEVAKDAATALGLLPEDGGLLAELVSAVGNFATMNPVAAAKDIADIGAVLSKQSKPKVAPAAGHTTQPPRDRLTHQGPGTGGASKYPDSVSPRPPQNALQDFAALSQAIASAIIELVRGGSILPPSTTGNPPIARPAPGDVRIDIPDNERRDFANNPLRNGLPVLGRPISEISYDDILRDKSLSFEDVIFLFMSKMGADMKKQMQDQMAEIADMNKALDKKEAGTDKAAGSTATGKPAGVGGGLENLFKGGVDGLLKELLKPENLKGALTGALDIAKVAAPVVLPVIGTAVGTIAPGIGNAIGGLAGGVGGAALGVGLELAKGAVESGAFDGILEGLVGFAGGPPGAAGGSAGAGGQPALDTKTKSGIERDRDFALEKLKLLQQRLTEMQQALSNILNAQHQTAMNTIGNIR